MKKALVHDWYYVSGGAEKVIHSIVNTYDDLEHFALIDFLNDADRDFILRGAKVNTSFIQRLPTAKSNHRKFLQFFPQAIEQFDLSKFDVVISSSASIAKGVLTSSKQLHICYCHSPMRYAWDFYHQYLKEARLNKGLKSWYAKRILHKIRVWDVVSSNRVDYFIANSNYIAKRIKKVYNRDSTVIYPPVNIEQFKLNEIKEDYYLAASRLVSYKKIDLIVKTFSKMPNRKLIVVGDGPDFRKIKNIATKNIEVKGFVSKSDLIKYMQRAKGFIFPAEEDFGIIPVEAQACGTPVIAYGKGGCLETIIENKTGVFFHNQTEKSLTEAIINFEKMKFNPFEIRKNSERFSKERFESEFSSFINKKTKEFFN